MSTTSNETETAAKPFALPAIHYACAAIAGGLVVAVVMGFRTPPVVVVDKVVPMPIASPGAALPDSPGFELARPESSAGVIVDD